MKLKRKLAIALLVVTMLGTGSALAANHLYSFVIPNVVQNVFTPIYPKSDSEPNWYLSIDSSDPDNNLSSTNIFGVRARKSTTTAASAYHTFSNFVTSYAMPYTISVSTGTNIYMAGKKDDTSTSSEALYVSGYWCP